MARIILFLLLSWSCLSYSFDWQGHRGARGLYPENTVGSMLEALKYPVTTLELDVVLSKDQNVIVSHEPWMNKEICLDPEGKRIKGREFNIYKLTLDQIIKFDCGSIPYDRFPEQQNVTVGKPKLETLLDVTEATLKQLNRKEVGYNIEIKSSPEEERDGFQPDVPTFSDIVVKAIKSKLPESRFTIQSFDWRVLRYIHKKYPEIRLVALSEDKILPEKDIERLGFKPYIFSPFYQDLKKNHVDAFHEMGVKVIPWTVNSVEDMRRIKSLGVDGIITDYPNRIEVVEQKKCKEGFNYFEGNCIKLPSHSLPSNSNPGWICKPGYIQKRSKCIKINVPSHAHLLEDGKTWECNPGYVRYRSTCKKK